ncbi:hypothetical protein P9112_010438 [Eukaryota sp. TZLM1-RC]
MDSISFLATAFPNLSQQQIQQIVNTYKSEGENKIIDECLRLNESPTPASNPSNSLLRNLHSQRTARRGTVKTKPSPRSSLADIRKVAHQRWRQTRKPREVNTLAKLEARARAAPPPDSHIERVDRGRIHTIENTVNDPLRMGQECLTLTNQFRRSRNLPELQWHQTMYTVGVVHSKNMAEKKVPFGHQGFNQRTAQFGFSFTSAAENVAYNSGCSEPAKVAVDGWIKSPGHCKNLLGRFSFCAIGVFRLGSTWYFTQLFAG